MEEKILITGDNYNLGKKCIRFIVIVSLVIGLIIQALIEGQTVLGAFNKVSLQYGYWRFWIIEYLLFSLIPLVVLLILYFMLNANELVVTDKRVYGKAAFLWMDLWVW